MEGKGIREQIVKAKRNMIISRVSEALGEEYYVQFTKDGNTIIDQKPGYDNRHFRQAQLSNQNRVKHGMLDAI